MGIILKGKIKGEKATKIVRFGNVKSVGVGDTNYFIENFRGINGRIEQSRNAGFHIESMSLQLQLIDLWLRELIKERTGEQFTFGEKHLFGKIIEKSKQLLPPKLYDRIDASNKGRIETIHNFIYGGTNYDKIENISKRNNSLHSEIFKFVVKEVSHKYEK